MNIRSYECKFTRNAYMSELFGGARSLPAQQDLFTLQIRKLSIKTSFYDDIFPPDAFVSSPGTRPDRLIAVTAREERSGLDSRWGWSELDTEVPRPAPTKRPSGHASSGRPNRGEARARRTRPDVPAKELRPADRAVRKRSLAPEGPPEERSTGHIWRQIREAGRSKNGGKEGAASKVRSGIPRRSRDGGLPMAHASRGPEMPTTPPGSMTPSPLARLTSHPRPK